MKKLIIALILLSGNCLAENAINISLFSKHLDDPKCEENKENRYCLYAIENDYNEFNPGLNLEITIDDPIYLMGGFVKNSYDETSWFAGTGIRFLQHNSWAIGTEIGPITNHRANFFATFYVKNKFLKIGYLPSFSESSAVIYVQYRFELKS